MGGDDTKPWSQRYINEDEGGDAMDVGVNEGGWYSLARLMVVSIVHVFPRR